MEQVTSIDEEYIFEGSSIISQTDLHGIITYANRKFCDISGYGISELVGKSHNVIKHPLMPSIVFEKMWQTISSGHTWSGLIKNMRKDGRFYWVDTEILPILDADGKLTGYIASRRAPSRKSVKESDEIYKEIYSNSRFLNVNL